MVQLELHSVFYNDYIHVYKAKKVGEDKFFYINDAYAIDEKNGGEGFKPPLIKTVDLFIQFVIEIEEFTKDKEDMILDESKFYSSHAHFIVSIKEVIDEYTFSCDIENLGEVIINCEREQPHIKKGMKVVFSGELSMEIIEQS